MRKNSIISGLNYHRSNKQVLKPKRPDNTGGGRSRQGGSGGRQGNF